MNDSVLLWKPTRDFKEGSRMTAFMRWLKDRHQLHFSDYASLWTWSVEEPAVFWECIWEYFEVQAHQPYREVLSGQMPEARWFAGSTLNYAEHIFRAADPGRPAILFQSERTELQEISWGELGARVAGLAGHFRELGVRPGDRVVGFLPNIPEATIAFLAACAVGAVWSSCSPDFGVDGVISRFEQIEPTVLIAVDGYAYGGKAFDKSEVVEELRNRLTTLKETILIRYLDPEASWADRQDMVLWEAVARRHHGEFHFTPVPFEHPIWVLYSSGTTGKPKAITHSHGGVLLEHYKYLALHNDVHPGERFFWYTTTGWMMWNFVQASLLVGATIVLYDGSPAYPDLGVLWRLAESTGMQHFGTSAPFLVAGMKQGIRPGRDFDLTALRSIGSTGAPLPPEAFDYVYQAIKPDVWLCSMSGGTDVCTAFVGGNPLLPVYEGEIQCRTLGCALYAFDEQGRPLINKVGEMVVTEPMPSMPVFFWNDPDGSRYRDSYFAEYPGIWRHGDWVRINDRGGLVILGRSDATLNRQGIRIGTAEIYRSVDKITEVRDSLIVNLELSGGRHYMPLFVVLTPGSTLNDDLISRIKRQLREDHSPRHVPDEIIAVPDIPYTISGKKLEAPVKKILLGMSVGQSANKDALRNPEALEFFMSFRKESPLLNG